MNPAPNPGRRRSRAGRRFLLVTGAALLLVAGAAEIPSARARAGDDSAALVQEANRKVRQKDTAGAIQLLQRAIAADPANVDAHVRYQDLARSAVGLPQIQRQYSDAAKAKPDDAVAQFLAVRLLPAEQAVDEFKKLASRFADSPWPCAGLARASEALRKFGDAAVAHADAIRRAGAGATRFEAFRAYGFEQQGDWAQAVDAWKAIVPKTPKDLSARFGLAEALRKNGQLDEALVALDEAAKVGAAEPELAYRRGLVHFDAGRWDKALESFDASIGLDRGMIESYCAGCETAILQAYATADAAKRDVTEKDFEKATGYGERAVITDPESAYAHFVLGAAYEAAGELNMSPDQLDPAVKQYDAALERLPIPGPDKVRVLTAKAWVLILKSSWDGALDAAQRAIDIDPKCAVAYGHAGYALAGMGKQQDAIAKYYKKGLAIDPRNARISHDMGIAYRELKKPLDAKKPLEDAVSWEPKNGRYHLSLGELYYELKKNKEAAQELFEATEALPRSEDAWRAYGRACYSAKSWEECARAYEKVVGLFPEAKTEHLILAVVYAEQLKDKTKAKAHATKFRENGGSDPNLDDWLSQLLADATGNKP